MESIDELREEFPNPLWYFKAERHRKELSLLSESNRDEYEVLKEKYYDLFEECLEKGEIVLGDEEGGWDDGRWKPPDTMVLHNTSMPPGLSPLRLSAIELFRLYTPIYAFPQTRDEVRRTQGEPISSGHVRGGEQVFWPYHWLILEDGTPVRLLYDNEVGWQAGDAEVNRRSVGICFDGDFENSRPNDAQLKAVAWLRKNYYRDVYPYRIFGHCEINKKTTCPSKFFLSEQGRRGWKEDLLAYI